MRADADSNGRLVPDGWTQAEDHLLTNDVSQGSKQMISLLLELR